MKTASTRPGRTKRKNHSIEPLWSHSSRGTCRCTNQPPVGATLVVAPLDLELGDHEGRPYDPSSIAATPEQAHRKRGLNLPPAHRGENN